MSTLNIPRSTVLFAVAHDRPCTVLMNEFQRAARHSTCEHMAMHAHGMSESVDRYGSQDARLFPRTVFARHGLSWTIVSGRRPQFGSNFWCPVRNLTGVLCLLTAATSRGQADEAEEADAGMPPVPLRFAPEMTLTASHAAS